MPLRSEPCAPRSWLPAISFFARIASAYRTASVELAGHLRGPLPKTPVERLALVDELFNLKTLRSRWHGDELYCCGCMGDAWRGEQTDFSLAHSVAQWCRYVDEAPLKIPIDHALSLAGDPELLATLTSGLETVAAATEKLFRALLKTLDFEITAFVVAAFENLDLHLAAMRFRQMAGACKTYHAWVHAAKMAARLEDLGLASLAARMDAGTLSGFHAAAELRFARAERLWEEARQRTTLLQELDSLDRHQLVQRFTMLEREHLQNNVTKIRASHLSQMPQGALGEMKVLRGEIGKKRRHLPIRKLVSSAPNAVQRIKPVLLMSPISVAQYLPPGTLTFDLLVIDEASQVRPEDALGAVARARQIVVVGDPKQLPPTSFFDRLLLDDENQQDEADEEQAASVGLLGGAARLDDLESILTLCEARGLSTRMLKWHYRSKDPSLITVSNREFYKNQLILPPSPLQQDPRYGLCFTRVQGVYDRGEKRDNRIEGDAVVQRIADHARADPHLTLGVATFSAAQRNLITELLELARRTDPVLNDFARRNQGKRLRQEH